MREKGPPHSCATRLHGSIRRWQGRARAGSGERPGASRRRLRCGHSWPRRGDSARSIRGAPRRSNKNYLGYHNGIATCAIVSGTSRGSRAGLSWRSVCTRGKLIIVWTPSACFWETHIHTHPNMLNVALNLASPKTTILDSGKRKNTSSQLPISGIGGRFPPLPSNQPAAQAPCESGHSAAVQLAAGAGQVAVGGVLSSTGLDLGWRQTRRLAPRPPTHRHEPSSVCASRLREQWGKTRSANISPCVLARASNSQGLAGGKDVAAVCARYRREGSWYMLNIMG